MHDMQKKSARAFAYLVRRRRKTVTLAIIFLVLSFSVLSGIMIFHSVEASLKELREQFYGYVAVNAVGDDNSRISQDLAARAAKEINADGWTGTTTCYLSVDDISLIPGRFTPLEEPAMSLTRLYSCRDSSLARDFTFGILSICQGRHLVSEDRKRALISENLAEINELHIGDRITCVVTDDITTHANAGLGSKYEFEITGIYRVESKQGDSTNRAECDILDNVIYVDEYTGFDIEKNIWCKPEFYTNGLTLWLKDPAQLEKAVQTLKNTQEFTQGDYHIESNSAEYDHSAAPMRQTEQIMFIFLIVISGIGAIFLIVTLSMWNKERMPENGILLSLGFQKKDIFLQLLFENSILFLVGFTAAVPLAFFCSHFLGSLISIGKITLFPGNILLAGIIVWILCVLTTLLSAVRIMKKAPAEIVNVII
ncbi:FtsX-like permease family protein [Lachnospiraceae bacterium 45-W7]